MEQSPNDTKALVAKFLALWEKADITNLMGLFADDVLYHDMTSGSIIKYCELERFLAETFAREEGSSLEFHDVIYPKDGSVLLHWRQNLQTRESVEPIEIGGVELIVFEHDKIVSVHEFYDYRGVTSDPADAVATDSQDEQLSKLGLSELDLQTISTTLSQYFEGERPFLDPRLNLAAVSKAMGYTRNQISYVINHVIGCTFYEFVNKHRVNHVIARMEEADADFSIVKVAIESGFNTISGFYNAFKRQTGVTPSVYRQTALNSLRSVRTREDDALASSP
ncbi:MAG: nuclear transport factor 2 family protein [Pseudomonadota bacterium]